MQWQPLGHSLQGPAGPLPPRTLLLLPPPLEQPLPLLRADADLLVIGLDLLLLGSTPLLHCSFRAAAELSSATSNALIDGGISLDSNPAGLSLSSFDAPSLPAGHWLWLVASQASGTITGLHLSVHLQPATAS
jgi:hypothetical protein